ncbi:MULTISPECIES: hypothetical protein [unclassified Paenarthrobacter]|uniref:hypothetical protein n=1 Tax=unclassified Paenarthrobacter TaxID=2634190 RepID=UPI003CF3EEFC
MTATGRRSLHRQSLAWVSSIGRQPGSMVLRLVSSRIFGAFAVGAGALCVRAVGLERAFEVWVDELLYVQLGQSVSAGHFPTLPDGPFFLHPPGYFLLEAAVISGYGILCKDFFIICTAAPLVLAAVWKRTLPWRQAGVVLASSAVPYTAYLMVVALNGFLPSWWEAKSQGLLRVSGVEKSTGFTAEGSPSIVDRLVEQSATFGTSYVLLALCPIAGLLLCFSLSAPCRLLGLVGLGLGTAGAYSALFGTFEEQYGYGVMVAGVICAVLAVTELRHRFTRGRRVLTAIAACFVAMTILLGTRTVATVDSGFVQAREWVRTHLPADARVSVTNSTGKHIFEHDPRFGVWPSAALMQAHGASYILTQSAPTLQGYGYANPTMLAWLEEHAVAVFSASGPTNGRTTLWWVDGQDLKEAAATNVGSPSKDSGTER